jgi:ribosome-associated heat shock protein Hsp15
VRVFTDREHIVVVRQILAKRVGAPLAQAAYDDRTPALPPKEERVAPVFARERGAGRPTKRDRRVLDRLRELGR